MAKGRKIIVAITGASGSIYAERLLKRLAALDELPEQIAVVLSDTAKEVWKHETGKNPKFLPSAKIS